MHAHERTLSSLTVTRTRPRSDGGIRAASRGDDGSSWLAAAAAHVARLRVTRTCQHQQGADESPEGREERGDTWACTRALCGRVARVRALTVPPLLPPLQAEDLVEGPPWPPALQTLAPELRECARSRRSGCQHARTVRIQSRTSRGYRRASSEDTAARPRRYLSCGWLRRGR